PIARSVRGLHADGWPTRDLRICAVRARDARRVVFGTAGAPLTDVGTAVAASCAIPAYFRPVTIDGAAYVDGGVHSPTNADVLLGEGFDLVLVLSPMSLSRSGRRPPIDLALRLAVRRYLAAEVRKLRRAGTRVVVVQPGPDDLLSMGVNPMRGTGVEQVLATVGGSVTERLAVQPEVRALLSTATG
ncbi:MAG: patatin-like phospholipase family protein, partial [Actinomycetota bacterium]|nr:patatin-like phospholipase family protein [Actinomycetota bacterium]